MPLTTKLRDVRVNLANRRTERGARRRLCAELDFILGRHTQEETREIREILNQQDYERQRAGSAIGGYRG